MLKDLSALFSPKSIAIVGASRSPEKVGAVALKNIVDSKFNGRVYPINPNAEMVNDLKCFPDIKSLPEIVDLIIIAIPAELVTQALDQAGEKGIRNAVIFSAGFKEIGPDGEKLEKELLEIVQKYKINLLGPNCLGFINNLLPINATFGEQESRSGNLRFISQSGAIAASLFDWCKSTGLGFSEFITLGNKTALSENDVLEYFQNVLSDNLSVSEREGLSAVRPIGMYLESISNGSDFLHITSQISKKDPIFILKPGKTKEAAKAMQSHTGAIAGEDSVLETALSQAGVIRCKTLEDFFDLSRAFAWENAPQGPKVAIISNAGGPGVISADAVVSEGLELAEFDSPTKDHLAKVLPRSAIVLDPVDVMGDALADRFAKASEIILQTNQADALVVILTPQVMTQIEKTAEALGNLSKKYQKPIFCSFIGGNLVAEGEQKLNEFKIPSFRFPERAIAAIGAMWKWKKSLNTVDDALSKQIEYRPNQQKIREIIDKAVKENQTTLDNIQANEIISAIGINTPKTQDVTTEEEAISFAQKYGWPIVLKLSSPGLLHKTDVGGVVTDISNEKTLELAWDKLEHETSLLDSEIQKHIKIQVQKHILNGIEVIVGVKHDPTFGLALLFGAGGSLAELINDRNLHLLPLDFSQAKRLVEKSKIYSILKGYRGEPPYALNKLYELIFRLGKLAQETPEITEIEINPVIVTLNDVFAVDSKVILKEEVKKVSAGPKFQLATTINHEVLGGKYHYFVFESDSPLNYKPGQYISVKVAEQRINAYSIAGHEGNKFNILVDTSPGGPGSKFFENLKVGEKITFLGPFGIFTLKPVNDAKHVLFLGTGSGCSPLKCMLEAALEDKNYQVPITLYFGLRRTNDVFWKDHFEELTKKYPNFNFKLVLSQPDGTWQGETGHITELANKDFPDLSSFSAYLCGNHAMIEEAKNILLTHGCPKDKIYTEKF